MARRTFVQWRAQPRPAVQSAPEAVAQRRAQPRPAVQSAKGAQSSYKRNLPQLQYAEKTLFITFTTYKRWVLPESLRAMVLQHCLHDNDVKLALHAVVVMPDHVHMVATPLADDDGNVFGLAEIMSGIKGASAHAINRALSRKGPVWQGESFDRQLRSDEMRERSVSICVRIRFVRASVVVKTSIRGSGAIGSKERQRDENGRHSRGRLCSPLRGWRHGVKCREAR